MPYQVLHNIPIHDELNFNLQCIDKDNQSQCPMIVPQVIIMYI